MRLAPCAVVLAAAGGVAFGACSTGGGSGEVSVASCSDPGGATAGTPDDHCASAGPDGGPLVQAVTLACDAPVATAGDGGGPAQCPWGPTRYGMEADDDDCKYHVAWTSSPICPTPGAVTFTVKATVKATGAPLKGATPVTEVFVTSPADCGIGEPALCDDCSTVPGKNSGAMMTEGPPGTYTAPIEFQTGGAWTVRFHFFSTCTDEPAAPHGHVAFHVTVP